MKKTRNPVHRNNSCCFSGLPLQRSSLALTIAGIIGSALLGTSAPAAFAQEEVDEVVVTGSRIRRQDFTANSPITTLDRNTFEETSTVGIETVLNQLPQFVPAVTQFTTTDVQNTATNTVGASTVSLRGLGANRNLVLIDGRRGQPVNASLVVDTNSIPAAAIERVEIISGGASAVYGADAVGGVVNFILKDNFEGATIDTRYGITEAGDNEEYTISALFGANVANGDGNVMFGMEHSSRGIAYAVDRDWRVDQFNNPNIAGNDFWFSETYIQSDTGSNLPSQAAINALFPDRTANIPRNASFYINPTPDGSGTVFAGAGSFTGASGAGGAYKYDGPMYRDEYPGVAWRKVHSNGQITENALDSWTSIPLDRFSFFGKGTYDFSDAVTGRIQANFSRNRNKTLLGFAGAGLGGNNARVPYGSEIYAPSLNADGSTNAAYLPGGLFGLNCPAIGGCTETQAFPLPPEMQTLLNSRANPDDDIRINRNLDFMGFRRSEAQTTTFQVLAGLEGELDNNWAWDAVISHGQTEVITNFGGFTSLPRWREVVASPNFGRGFSRTGNELGAGRAAGTATCTTGLPVIAEFEMSDDCRRALQSNLQNNSQLEQNVFEANLTGDLLEMPAGQLQFALGATYRNYEYVFHTDNMTTNENYWETTLGLFPTTNTQGRYSVKEVYGEVLVPVVANLPGIQALNLELGGRLSDFSTIGEVETFKALVDWTITDFARLRGGYNLANRAPNIGELFLARTQVFGATGGIYGDQCSENLQDGPFSANPAVNLQGASGAARTKAICQIIMGPTAAAEYYGRPVTDQPLTGGTGLPNTTGNPNLDSEEAETWTWGLVLNSPWQNPWLESLTASIDWYQIEITDMIAVENADPVFQRCLDPALNPGEPAVAARAPACSFAVRDVLNGNIVSLDLQYTNTGRALTSGADLQLNWNGNMRELGIDFIPGNLGVTVLANFNLENITQTAPEIAEVDWVGTSGCALQMQCMGYDYRVFTTFSWFNGPWNASLRWSHIPSIDAGAAATNPATTQIGVDSAYNVFALAAGYRLGENTIIRGGVENILDTKPPYQGGNPVATPYPLDATRATNPLYDQLGRRYFVNVTVNF